jgi:hypothetical protein
MLVLAQVRVPTPHDMLHAATCNGVQSIARLLVAASCSRHPHYYPMHVKYHDGKPAIPLVWGTFSLSLMLSPFLSQFFQLLIYGVFLHVLDYFMEQKSGLHIVRLR